MRVCDEDVPTTADRAAMSIPIGSHALIGDCHGSALVGSNGEIDWCCLPRFDSPSCMAGLLDPSIGGFWRFGPEGPSETERRYVDGTLVLETTHRTEGGAVRFTDCMVMPPDQRRHRILRVVEGVEGTVDVVSVFAPHFAYGAVLPWVRKHDEAVFSAVGGSTGLVLCATLPIEQDGPDRLVSKAAIGEGERHVLSLDYLPPAEIDPSVVPEGLRNDEDLDATIEWWREWARWDEDGRDPAALRSAIVLKALCYEPTGAMVAAPTTSLPETPGGERNWDYRYSWVRDSAIAARALIELGFDAEATGFRRFIERSAAGSAEEVQPLYGLAGEIRANEYELGDLSGYLDSRPVRVGNLAVGQLQLDAFGFVIELAWRWHIEGVKPSSIYWQFLVDLIETIEDKWDQPDRGIWETRGDPLHFVHSKAMAWAALNIGLQMADELGEKAPETTWRRSRDEIREAIETRGYDSQRGVFTRSFDSRDVDAALLLLPWVEFVSFDDPRMIRTTDAIMEDLGEDGLVRRYVSEDGLEGNEGIFVACSFWLVECLARQGRLDEARHVFDRVSATSNDLGLFSEEYDPTSQELLGNFPQALSHLSHITAVLALDEAASGS